MPLAVCFLVPENEIKFLVEDEEPKLTVTPVKSKVI